MKRFLVSGLTAATGLVIPGLLTVGSVEPAIGSVSIEPAKGVAGALNGVSMQSETSGWVVGKNPASRGPIVKHWNGISWHFTPVPHPANGNLTLYGVDGSAADDVWAAGWLRWDSGGGEPAILHWNGMRWQRLTNELGDVALYRIDARTPDDAWAVGYDFDRASSAVLHWDGTGWRRVTLPAKLRASSLGLNDIEAIAANDVWTVGSDFRNFGPAVALHWDGKSWTRVMTPHGVGRKVDLTLFGISASASDDVWASGIANDPDGIDGTDALIEHWDGRRWRVVHNAQPHNINALQSVAAVSHRNAWAVGYTQKAGHEVPFIQHWDGSAWTIAKAPPVAGDSELIDVAVGSGATAWAVGLAGDSLGSQQVILMWNGHEWTRQQS